MIIFLTAVVIWLYLVGCFASVMLVGLFEDMNEAKGFDPKPVWFLFLMIFGWPFSWITVFVFNVLDR